MEIWGVSIAATSFHFRSIFLHVNLNGGLTISSGSELGTDTVLVSQIIILCSLQHTYTIWLAFIINKHKWLQRMHHLSTKRVCYLIPPYCSTRWAHHTVRNAYCLPTLPGRVLGGFPAFSAIIPFKFRLSHSRTSVLSCYAVMKGSFMAAVICIDEEFSRNLDAFRRRWHQFGQESNLTSTIFYQNYPLGVRYRDHFSK